MEKPKKANLENLAPDPVPLPPRPRLFFKGLQVEVARDLRRTTEPIRREVEEVWNISKILVGLTRSFDETLRLLAGE